LGSNPTSSAKLASNCNGLLAFFLLVFVAPIFTFFARYANVALIFVAHENFVSIKVAILNTVLPDCCPDSLKSYKPVYDGMKAAKDKASYRREHESAIILYEAAAKALRKHAGDSGKLPNPATLQAEYAKLTEKKNALRAVYGKLKQQAREYGVVKRNIDSNP